MIQKSTGYVTGDDSVQITSKAMVDELAKQLDFYFHQYPGEFLSNGHALVILTHLQGESDIGKSK